MSQQVVPVYKVYQGHKMEMENGDWELIFSKVFQNEDLEVCKIYAQANCQDDGGETCAYGIQNPDGSWFKRLYKSSEVLV